MAAASLSVTTSAWAQSEASESPETRAAEQRFEQSILVTGSRIPRNDLTAVSPVTLIHGEEVELQGTVRVEDLVNSLPQAFADQGANIVNSATGTATVNLRGLGPFRTLVLVNSRRLMPGSPTLPAADLNMIPASIVDRVEVMTGGASSVYGSDAVAGVVNFILDTDFQGLRLDALYSFYQHDNRDGSDLRQAMDRRGFGYPTGHVADGGAFDINLAIGTAFGDGRGHITAYAGYRRVEALLQGRRDYSACVSQARAGSDILDCGGSRTSANGTFIIRSGQNFQLGPGRQFVPGFTLFNFAPTNHFQRPDERYVAGLFADYEVDPSIVPYLEFMFMDDRTIAQIAPSGNFGNTLDINCDNVLLSAQQRAIACAPDNLVTADGLPPNPGNPPLVFLDQNGNPYFRGVLAILRRNVEGGGRRDNLQHTNFRLVGGVEGQLDQAWSYDAHYLIGRVNFMESYEADFSIRRINRAIDVVEGSDGRPVCRSALTGTDPACVPWDVFAPGQVTPAALDYLQTPGLQRALVEQRIANVSFTALLGEYGVRSPLAADGVGLNFGAEYRRDSLNRQPDSAFQANDLAGIGIATLPVRGSYEVRELFAEMRIPVVTDRLISLLSVEAGYRRSYYDNNINRFSNDTWKLGVELAPVHDVRLRASYHRAIRAPNIPELFSRQAVAVGAFDPCVGSQPQATQAQCLLTGVTAAQYGNITPNPFSVSGDAANALFGGNPNLEPETATTKTIGLVFQPRWIPDFAVTADWFDIEVEDTIATIGGDVIVDTCIQTGDPDFCGRIRRDRFGSLWFTPDGFVDDTLTNIGRIRTRGVDVGASFRRPFEDRGSMSLDLNGTWLDEWLTDNGGLSVPFDCAGLYGLVCTQPRPEWRHRIRLSLSGRDGVGLSLQWRHFASVDLDRSSDQSALAGPFSPRIARIPAQNYLDLTVTFRAADHYGLRLGVRNLLDREPPVVGGTGNRVTASCPLPSCNANTYPQLYDALGRYIFAGITFDF